MNNLLNLLTRLSQLAKLSDVRCKHACAIIHHRSGEIVAEGFNYNYHKRHRNRPWTKEGKWTMHEESIRIPFIIADLRKSNQIKGKISHEFALNIDVAPTVHRLGA